MESPGEYLKREREVRGVSLEHISNVTKIRVGLLTALECNDFDALPETPFVKGFIHAYCKDLGLDAYDAILRYEAYMRDRAENENSASKHTYIEKIHKHETRAPFQAFTIKATVLVAITVIAGIIYTYTFIKKQISPAHESPYSQINQQTVVENNSKEVLDARKEEPSLTAKSEGHSAKTISPSISETKVEEQIMQTKEVLNNYTVAEGSNRMIDEPPLVLIIEATKPSWIKTEIDGHNLFEVSLKKGEKVKWNAKEKFSVILGNAGGVNVTFNGKPINNLGAEGAVVKLVLPPNETVKTDQ